MKDFNEWPSALQILISALFAVPLTAALIIIVMALTNSVVIASYIATMTLWTGVILAWLAARNNGGVRHIWAMLFLIASLAFVSTVESLHHLGLISISALTLTRMFLAVLILTGITMSVIFGARYARAKHLKKAGLIERNIRIKLPLGHGNENATERAD